MITENQFLINPNRPVRVDHGLRLLAWTCYCGAVEDCMGRHISSCNAEKTRRLNAAQALQWLREGLRPGPLEPFTCRWCAHLLDMSPKQLVLGGVARIKNSGLRDNWRKWRAERGDNRIKRLPVLSKECAHCHCTFTTKQEWRVFCSTACCNASRRQQQEQREGTTASVIRMGAPGYRGFADYCTLIGTLPPWTETQWRVMTTR